MSLGAAGVRVRLLPIVALATAIASCENVFSLGGPGDGCNVEAPPEILTANPLLVRPFAGIRTVVNYFDHDLPAPEDRGNGFQRTFCGSEFRGPVDGHTGYDWLMPQGTSLFAAFDGVVEFAGNEPPFVCGSFGVVSGLSVQLRHVANQQRHVIVYAHLSALNVQAGDTVAAGDVVAASGNTGCSTEPHLHFEVWRSDNGGPLIATDPYGWWPLTPDPWAAHPRGAASVWLWKPGQAP
jgi:murein DD-endopeptidase MepM/ murein hydrolase activator NlpD